MMQFSARRSKRIGALFRLGFFALTETIEDGQSFGPLTGAARRRGRQGLKALTERLKPFVFTEGRIAET